MQRGGEQRGRSPGAAGAVLRLPAAAPRRRRRGRGRQAGRRHRRLQVRRRQGRLPEVLRAGPRAPPHTPAQRLHGAGGGHDQQASTHTYT
ncbi:hypothetical protein HF086_017807 [Spodoptera exigua]|uniref:Uncharacterized protein n=1 Tax=Spodoptera exigua TaxID=7107 RepID=A0A922MH65_SPOEX|nr:hypothetical protein HF086_017807 [Spodoptera exigua]